MLRALALLLFCALATTVQAALPTPPDDGLVLRIQGSNTIGASLGPALVKGWLVELGLHGVHDAATGKANEQRVLATTEQGRRVRVDIAAHGSSTGFTALKVGSADLAAASRPIKDSERQALESLGDLKSPEAEQVIAIDGVAIILHPQNPLTRLDTRQLAKIFAGEVKTWEELGGIGGPIHLYARDDQSGTWDTFRELVLTPHGKSLSNAARRFESSEQLSDAVSQDPAGIGFIGLPYVRQAKAVAIVDGDSQAMLPLASLIATEDYPLSRRLFFYLPPNAANPWAQSLVRDPAMRQVIFDLHAASQSLVEQQPDNPLAHFNAGCFAARAGRADDAIEHLRRAVEINERIKELMATDEVFIALVGQVAWTSMTCCVRQTLQSISSCSRC